jgi:hypothetical protein
LRLGNWYFREGVSGEGVSREGVSREGFSGDGFFGDGFEGHRLSEKGTGARLLVLDAHADG